MWERKPRPPVGEQGMSKRYRDDASLAWRDEAPYSSPLRLGVSIAVSVSLVSAWIVVSAIDRVTGDQFTGIVRGVLGIGAVVAAAVNAGVRKHPYPSAARHRWARLGGLVGVLTLASYAGFVFVPLSPDWVVILFAVLSLVCVAFSAVFYLPYDYRADRAPTPGAGSQDATARLDRDHDR